MTLAASVDTVGISLGFGAVFKKTQRFIVVCVRRTQVTSGSSMWTGNGVYLQATSSLQALSKACGNSSSAAFEDYLFPNQKILLSGRSAPAWGCVALGGENARGRKVCLNRKVMGERERRGRGKRSAVLYNRVPPELMWRRVR